jgi:hypothetical protein
MTKPLIVDLLDFTTPRGFRLHTASFVAEQFTAAATLSALPILDGSLAYTYTSKPLKGIQGTSSSALVNLVQGFREVKLPRAPEQSRDWEIWQGGRRVDFRGIFQSVALADGRHTVLRKDVSTHRKAGRDAYSKSISCMAIYFLLRIRPACRKRKCSKFLPCFAYIDDCTISTRRREIFYRVHR